MTGVSDNLLYWIFLGLSFALPFALGIWLMRATKRMQLAFWVSTALNVGLTVAVALWWDAVNTDSFRTMFGVFFLVISAVNLAVLEFFALFSIRNKSET